MSVTEQSRPAAGGNRQSAKMLIGGAWVGSLSGATLSVENPAKRTPIADIPRGNAADVDVVVQAATKAFAEWSKVPPRQRGRLLLRIAEALEARIEEMARLIALETGNALRTQARGEATLTADIFRYFGGLAGELKGETIPLGEHVLSYTRREPLGVVGAARPVPVKVILETSMLDDEQKAIACLIALRTGAAYVKTSTGFGGGGATVEDIALMRAMVGNRLGVKASGAVRTREDAHAMLKAGADRIGASSSVAIVSGGEAAAGDY